MLRIVKLWDYEMSEKVWIDIASPLNRFHLFPEVLPGLIPGRSIENVFGYIMALQSGQMQKCSD